MRKATKFEQTLGHTFGDSNLRRALRRHRSVLRDKEALKQYGYCQAELASRGDKTAAKLIRKHLGESSSAKLTSRPDYLYLIQNRTMRLWLADSGLDHFLIQSGHDTAESSDHIYGTYFEALLQALLMDGAYTFAESWLRSYVDSSLARSEFRTLSRTDNKSPEKKTITAFAEHTQEHSVYSQLHEIQLLLRRRGQGKLKATTQYAARKKAYVVGLVCEVRDLKNRKKVVEVSTANMSIEAGLAELMPLLQRRLLRLNSPVKSAVLNMITNEIART